MPSATLITVLTGLIIVAVCVLWIYRRGEASGYQKGRDAERKLIDEKIDSLAKSLYADVDAHIPVSMPDAWGKKPPGKANTPVRVEPGTDTIRSGADAAGKVPDDKRPGDAV